MSSLYPRFFILKKAKGFCISMYRFYILDHTKNVDDSKPKDCLLLFHPHTLPKVMPRDHALKKLLLMFRNV
jgi:hypothetical protein